MTTTKGRNEMDNTVKTPAQIRGEERARKRDAVIMPDGAVFRARYLHIYPVNGNLSQEQVEILCDYISFAKSGKVHQIDPCTAYFISVDGHDFEPVREASDPPDTEYEEFGVVFIAGCTVCCLEDENRTTMSTGCSFLSTADYLGVMGLFGEKRNQRIKQRPFKTVGRDKSRGRAIQDLLRS